MNNELNARIAFIGGGSMARALIAGLVREGTPGSALSVGEPDAATRAALERDYRVRATADNDAAIHDASLVVLAVKPQTIAAVFGSLRTAWPAPPPVLLSIVAGLR